MSEISQITASIQAFLNMIAVAAFICWILAVVGKWKVFEKAGIAGWKALIPIYNDYILFDLMLGNGWYIFFVLIPFVGPMISSALTMFGRYRLAVAFGHGLWFAVGLGILNPIFMLILGFDDSVFDPELMPVDPE